VEETRGAVSEAKNLITMFQNAGEGEGNVNKKPSCR